jgi:hypothetical protein
VKGQCRGTAYGCDDGNVCTTDVCDGSGGCRFVVNTAPCDDGNACTAGDVCSAGRCSGAPISCDDGIVCTEDSCNPAVGCVHAANSARCDDANVCTDDACDPAAGCIHVANSVSCDDGNACTTGDVCSAGVCQGMPGACCPSYELSCTNGVDDDCDGLVDRDDPDCQCFPEPEWKCSNGRDEDCDGLVDYADPDCVLMECTEGCGWGYGCFPDGYCHSHCEDGAPDYDESDSDCGGADCPRCPTGRKCSSGWDCASGICINRICQ